MVKKLIVPAMLCGALVGFALVREPSALALPSQSLTPPIGMFAPHVTQVAQVAEIKSAAMCKGFSIEEGAMSELEASAAILATGPARDFYTRAIGDYAAKMDAARCARLHKEHPRIVLAGKPSAE